MFGIKSVLHVCLYISIFFLMSEETEVVLPGPEISSTGACPPNVTISLRSVSPKVSNTSLSYNVVCCRLQNARYCYQPHKNLQKLKALQCCLQLRERSGWFTCDTTNALGDIYNPDMGPFTLYVSYVVTNGTRYIYHSKMSHLTFGLRNIVCTKPSNFTATLTTDSVILSWGMPPLMDCLHAFRFRVRYFPHPYHCSDEEDEDNIQTISDIYSQSSNVTKFRKSIPLSSLKPRRIYLFELKCDVFGDKESAAAVNSIRTPSRVPRERPKFLRITVSYSKRRNITLSWEALNVSCPSKWGSEKDSIQLIIYLINTASQNGTNVTQTNSLSATSIKLGSDSNHFVISNVDRYQSLLVVIAYCNDAGCGPKTTQVITAEPKPKWENPPPRKTEPSNRGKCIAIVVLVTIVVVAAILGAVCYIYIKRANFSSQVDANRSRRKLKDIAADIVIGQSTISFELPSKIDIYQ